MTQTRITYATMSADDEGLHRDFEAAATKVRYQLGRTHPFVVNGEERMGSGTHEERSPVDHDIVVGEFAQATPQDVTDAVAAAKAFFPVWAGTPWKERAAILSQVEEAIRDNQFSLAALLGYEVGKNRLEALGDVAEAADFVAYYVEEMRRNDGFSQPMEAAQPGERNRDVLRPHGVWAVISPFNFPVALAAGPVFAALLTGNTVVLKPSNSGALVSVELTRLIRQGGVPAGAFHLVTGSGSVIGSALVSHPDVAGITFTGSYDVGMGIYRTFATTYPKPAVCEMGGKNPVIVTASADLEKAASGVLRSAFGFGGQKCSACSRVYVDRSVHDEFLARLREKSAAIRVGNPLERSVFLGPVIDEKAVASYEQAIADARRDGTIVFGGERVVEGDLGRGNFVQPTVVSVPYTSRIWKEELFLPVVAVGAVDSLDEALMLANQTEYGLTAGLFSQDQAEIDRFLNEIEAGVVYVNRAAGATSGAWPASQPFGGWKGSGTSGKSSGGPHYLAQYMREQSQTVVG